ncbi:cysteine synthase [Halobacteriales archaeon QS_4_69_34]|nr:MAG: cysteine synthase [Halobacteriales archaeon QS_4_69_34]
MDDSILDAIGSPLVRVASPAGATVATKVESFNPGGSAKDRPARAMVEAAEREGRLEPGDRFVEPTSGNTGIGLALVAAAKGYDLTVVMPESKSEERRRLMRAYGADLELIEGEMTDARERADELERQGLVQLRQFENPANPESHYRTTGSEIVEQTEGRTVDAFVAAVGTGGTIMGTGRRLREAFPGMRVIAVEPETNAVLSTGEAGVDDFQGMGPGFVSEITDVDLIDAIETVDLAAAEAECRRLAREEGLLVGQSSGASTLVARRTAARLADAGSEVGPDDQSGAAGSRGSGTDPTTDGGGDDPLVVTVLWDSGERYLSTGLFD